MDNATNLLKQLKNPLADYATYKTATLLHPSSVEVSFNEKTQKIQTKGLGILDQVEKDLIEIVLIEEVLEAKYHKLGVYIPRTFAENLPVIPHHVTAQAIFFSIATASTGTDIQELTEKFNYGLGKYDNLWIEPREPSSILEGEVVMIMNRRIGGWDGSLTRPVIELLCAGGHVPVCWNNIVKFPIK